MPNSYDYKKLYLLSAIGDALGTSVFGLKPEAIKSFYKMLSTFIDPTLHLKNKLHKWCKKGYYSYITQMNLINTYFLLTEHFNEKNYQNYLKQYSVSDLEFFTGIFRNASSAFKACFSNFPMTPLTRPITFSSAMVFPFVLFFQDERKMVDSVLRFTSIFSIHPLSSLTTLAVAFSLKVNKNYNLLFEIKKKFTEYHNDIHLHLKKNDFLSSTDFYSLMIEQLDFLSQPHLSREKGFAFIIQTANHYTQQHITRQTHSFPLSSIMTALFLASQIKEGNINNIFEIAQMGGESNIILTIVSMVLSQHKSVIIPEPLLKQLSNYKQIILYSKSMGKKRLVGEINDPYKMEYGLTKSMSLELNKLYKKQPQKKPKKSKEKKIQEKTILSPILPEKSDKRKWREYERKKTKEKKQRRRIKYKK